VAEQTVGGLEHLSSACFQTKWGVDHEAYYGLHQGSNSASALELEAFDKIFDGNLTASNVETFDVLFTDSGKGLSRQPQRRKATS
jgi:hypothetical protein